MIHSFMGQRDRPDHRTDRASEQLISFPSLTRFSIAIYNILFATVLILYESQVRAGAWHGVRSHVALCVVVSHLVDVALPID